MGFRKHRQSYRSFQYLDPAADYKEFRLAREGNEFEACPVPLTPPQEARVTRLAQSCVMISLHDHPVIFPARIEETFAYAREGRIFTAFEGLAQSYWDALFDNLMDGIAVITSKRGWKWTDVILDLGMRLCDIAHQDLVIRCESTDDIDGKIALQAHRLIPSLEGAAMIENELDRIEILFGLGVRQMGIAYSEANGLGSGLKEPRDGGLTHFGRQAVERMNKVGMAIDCSHAGDQTTLDVIQASAKPVFLTHVGARSLWNTRRMKPDDALQACADKGGVIGIEAAPHTTITAAHPLHGIESFMEHFEYVRGLVGWDHVAFGPDTLYGDHVGLHHAFAQELSIRQSHEAQAGAREETPGFERVRFVRGLENPTEASHHILRWLVRDDRSDENIAKVMGGNILRALKQMWP
ncbi:MAG: diguanylate cyclase [Acidobacteria bacterium]|nr:diguanylate cyclase [Acidobacteriota bacterium]